MTIMIGGLYDALKEAGASEAKAREAATEVAVYENRLSKIDTDLAVLKWMSGFQIALLVAVLFKIFS